MAKDPNNWIVEIENHNVLVTSFVFKCSFKFQRGVGRANVIPKSEIFKGQQDQKTADRLFQDAYLIAVDAALEEWGNPIQTSLDLFDENNECFRVMNV
jgi:hypothetical protein